MRTLHLAIAALAAGLAAPAQARTELAANMDSGGSSEPSSYLQCVPYARELSGIQIYGDAHTWWDQAKGRYMRGTRPEVGAVMALRPHGNSRLGHVAAVSRVIDSRNVLISHANWSSPGEIERDVRAVDVSPDNDWSEVRIWFGPMQALGTGHWPLYGFIYNDRKARSKRGAKARRIARNDDVIGGIIAANMQ